MITKVSYERLVIVPHTPRYADVLKDNIRCNSSGFHERAGEYVHTSDPFKTQIVLARYDVLYGWASTNDFG